MEPKLWQEVNRVLDLVDELPEEEQNQSLRRACAGNEQLETEVRRQLRRMVDCPKGFLDLVPLESDRALEEYRALLPPTDSGAGAVPEVDADFRVIRELGRGGGGVVYEAQQRSLDRRVALKVLRPGADDDGRRLRREAKVLGGLDEPGIARIYGVGQHGAWPWIAMELVDGHDLAQEVSLQLGMGSAGDAPAILPAADEDHYLDKRLSLVRDVALALHSAHELGVIHRDVKSANIVLGRDGVPKLVDFGLARTAASETVTAHAFLAGSVHTMSDEQLRCAPLDRRTDVYSLGVVLYQLLAGQLPFPGRESPAVIAKIQSGVTPLLREAKPKLSSDIEAVCAKAMAFDRGQRYSNALAFAEDLERLLEGRPVKAQRWTSVYRAQLFVRRNRTAVTLGVGALLASTALLLWSSQLSHLSGIRQGALEELSNLEGQTETAIAARHNAELGSFLRSFSRLESNQDLPASSRRRAAVKREEIQQYALAEDARIDAHVFTVLGAGDGLMVNERLVLDAISQRLELSSLFDLSSDAATAYWPRLSLTTEHPGMTVELFGARYPEGGFEDTPAHIGVTPIESMRVTPGRYRIVVRDKRGNLAELSRWLGDYGRHYDEGQVKVRPSRTSMQDMVFVPAGSARIVIPDKDRGYPLETFEVGGFHLDAYEVSNADYARFLDSFTDQDQRIRHTGRFYNEGSALGLIAWDVRPVVGVSWWQARAYCEWAGKRLPTELEWALALSGDERRTFAWGTDIGLVPLLSQTDPADYLGTFEPESPLARSVASYLTGTHPTRRETIDRTPGSTPIFHLTSNVREWVDCVSINSFEGRLYAIKTDRRIKGGAWDSNSSKFKGLLMSSHTSEPADPNFHGGSIGFRCAKSIP